MRNYKNIFPTQYDKDDFLSYLKKVKVNDEIILIFNKLPEELKKNDFKYTLYINKIWYNIDNTYYNFELNYYSYDLNEFLFSPKVFFDVETSITHLYTNLILNKLI